LYGEFLKPHLVDVHGIPAHTRLNLLHNLLMASGKDGRLFEIRLMPDSEFGFVHGNDGIMEGPGVPQGKTPFIGSANDSRARFRRIGWLFPFCADA